MLLKDLLKIYNIDSNDCVLFRYGLYNGIKKDIEKYGVKEYASNCFNTDKKYLLFFLGETVSKSKLIGFYKVGKFIKKEDVDFELIPFNNKGYLELFEVHELNELINRLEIIYSHKIGWKKYDLDEIEVSAIYPKEIQRKVPYFTSFENINLSYEELEEIIENGYTDYKTTLKAINAIYMIIDTRTGKQYIGSSYGSEGLYGRWASYINTEGDGGNLLLKELKINDSKSYMNFKFIILKTLPLGMNPSEVIQTETEYKDKFMTKKFGLNLN